jgi:hypothetical protein
MRAGVGRVVAPIVILEMPSSCITNARVIFLIEPRIVAGLNEEIG